MLPSPEDQKGKSQQHAVLATSQGPSKGQRKQGGGEGGLCLVTLQAEQDQARPSPTHPAPSTHTWVGDVATWQHLQLCPHLWRASRVGTGGEGNRPERAPV